MDLDELRALVAVVERGSMARASKALRFPMATLRRRLDELEARVGVKLLERARDGAVPTAAGAALVEKARGLLSDVQSLMDDVRRSDGMPSGEVVIAVPPGLPPELVSTFLEIGTTLCPKVTWCLRSDDDLGSPDLFDARVAVTIGMPPTDSPWEVRRIGNVRERLLASPEYLARHGKPTCLEDLARHTLLSWTGPPGRAEGIPLLAGGTARVPLALRTSDIFLVRQCALRGRGIALVPDPPIPSDAHSTDSGLEPVLDDVVGSRFPVFLAARPSLLESTLLRLAFDKATRILEILSS